MPPDSASNLFYGVIDTDGTIYEMRGHRRGERVGVDVQRVNEFEDQIAEMQGVLDSWYPKMVEHGYIKIEKTAEQIARDAAEEQLQIIKEQSEQQNQINLKLLEAIHGLQAELSDIKSMKSSAPVVKRAKSGKFLKPDAGAE
jgi:cell division septum initiation protein DivIVA